MVVLNSFSAAASDDPSRPGPMMPIFLRSSELQWAVRFGGRFGAAKVREFCDN